MREKQAFLLILNPNSVPFEEKMIYQYLHDIGFHKVKPFSELSNLSELEKKREMFCLVVWHFDEKDKLSDEEVLSIVGSSGCVEYRCRCPICDIVRTRIENVRNHRLDRIFACECTTEEETV